MKIDEDGFGLPLGCPCTMIKPLIGAIDKVFIALMIN
jgi:hypothetical protein